ncbi:MAG: FAD-binding oxidoreductase [Candidatus Omnitrophica bacterium]|nr:FAD-binding oxidoreductase [Candidatus Omnitrophota bacterium]
MLRLTKPQEIEPYLRDASRFSGHAEGVVLPENEKEISEFLKEANQKKIPVTISGGKTGLTGAAVPLGGLVMGMDNLSRILEVKKDPTGKDSWARVQPGILLKSFREGLEKESLFYPPDPTGPKPFVGGTLATNASGPNSFKYGSTRPFVRGIRAVLANGEVIELKRGKILADRKGFLEIPIQKGKLRIQVPHYSWPSIKHSGGYYAVPQMDAIDLFIGSEGTLGVISEVELRLLPKPEQILSFIVFFPKEEDSWCFVRKIRKGKSVKPRVIEYLDSGSLEFLRPSFPSVPREAQAALFIEEETDPENEKRLSLKWRKLFEKEKALPDLWEAKRQEEAQKFREFRTALPLAVNEFIARHGQMKISTDTCVGEEQFEELMLFHRRRVQDSGLKNVTFGHIGESHVHLNLLPQDEKEKEKARVLYQELLKKAIAMGGTFSAEHGVGKLKHDYLIRLYGEKGVQEMREIKRVFDPNLILGRGNIFDIE